MLLRNSQIFSSKNELNGTFNRFRVWMWLYKTLYLHSWKICRTFVKVDVKIFFSQFNTSVDFHHCCTSWWIFFWNGNASFELYLEEHMYKNDQGASGSVRRQPGGDLPRLESLYHGRAESHKAAQQHGTAIESDSCTVGYVWARSRGV
jgi:hypothetical protein